MEERINTLESSLEDREAKIRELQIELDMFKQVVRPLTSVMTSTCPHCGMVIASPEDTTKTLALRKQAISAEPSQNQVLASPTKTPKSI
ncbi:unnamed protein product, partial [Nesidiocoris tenuis]